MANLWRLLATMLALVILVVNDYVLREIFAVFELHVADFAFYRI